MWKTIGVILLFICINSYAYQIEFKNNSDKAIIIDYVYCYDYGKGSKLKQFCENQHKEMIAHGSGSSVFNGNNQIYYMKKAEYPKINFIQNYNQYDCRVYEHDMPNHALIQFLYETDQNKERIGCTIYHKAA
jgi:hypothetical protein